MSNNLKDKIEDKQIVKDIKKGGDALVSDVKEIAKDSKEAASDTLDKAKEKTKEGLDKVEKKLG